MCLDYTLCDYFNYSNVTIQPKQLFLLEIFSFIFAHILGLVLLQLSHGILATTTLPNLAVCAELVAILSVLCVPLLLRINSTLQIN